MKRKLLVALLIVFVKHSAIAQAGNQYYFLKRPSSNVFFQAFAEPDGVSDPNSGPSSSTISDSDLEVLNSSFSESFYSNKTRNSNYLFSSWSNGRSVTIKGKLTNVKRVVLKNEAWQKIEDDLYHVVEALRADTVQLSMKRQKSDTVKTNYIQKIASIFVKNVSTVGKILAVFNNDTSRVAKAANNSIVRLNFQSEDSLAMSIIDNTVYYAVRYAKIDPNKDNVIKLLGIRTRKLAAPACGNEIKKDPIAVITRNLKGRTEQSVMPACQVRNARIDAVFVHDPTRGISNVVITRQRPNSSISRPERGKPVKQVIDTLYVSEYIDFTNRYREDAFSSNYQFVASENPNKNSIENTVAVCDFAFRFDVGTREMKILNWRDSQYVTCIYYETAKIKYYPK